MDEIIKEVRKAQHCNKTEAKIFIENLYITINHSAEELDYEEVEQKCMELGVSVEKVIWN